VAGSFFDGDVVLTCPRHFLAFARPRHVFYGDNPQAIAEAKKAMLESRELPPVIETSAELA